MAPTMTKKDPTKKPRIEIPDRKEPMLVRFFNRVSKSDSCWNWKANHDRHGYGLFTHKGSYLCDFAHRVSYELHTGPIPEGMVVCHRCDNPPCVNPEHLFLGTQLDNILDMQQKGRSNIVKGEGHWRCILTLEQVIEIKSQLANYTPGLTTRLAREYGVAVPTIKAIKARRIWKHVP